LLENGSEVACVVSIWRSWTTPRLSLFLPRGIAISLSGGLKWWMRWDEAINDYYEGYTDGDDGDDGDDDDEYEEEEEEERSYDDDSRFEAAIESSVSVDREKVDGAWLFCN